MVKKLMLASLVVLASSCDEHHETIQEKQVRAFQFLTPPLTIVAKDDNYDVMVRDKYGKLIVFDNLGIGRMLHHSYGVGDVILEDEEPKFGIDTSMYRPFIGYFLYTMLAVWCGF